MKPEIIDDNLYNFLLSCVEYVNYFGEITDEQFSNRFDQLQVLREFLIKIKEN